MHLRLVLPAATALVAAAVPGVRANELSQKIDALVEEGYKANRITPNAPASDETFVRRAYLDIIGRIPSMEEAKEFLDSSEQGKRAKLIDKLLDSEGYVSHWYNWWADILRVQSNMGGNDNREAGQAYAHWVKDALRNNKPYDQFVKELVTAEGYIWDNGAVGYYIRDAGMPLDNMSNTVQIFLGTRLACAQCHNHPFDKWTQKDYYEMAAFTYNVDTNAIASPELQADIMAANDKIAKEGGKRGEAERKRQSMRRVIEGITEPMRAGVSDNNGRMLNLPNDYKYEDARAGAPVEAHTITLSDRDKGVKSQKEQRAAYAAWMTSQENPRFSTVIANRLWKRVMGMGLIEPMDDFKDDTSASNPALMKYLSQQVVAGKYDLKKILRAMYNTRTYQRQVTTSDVPEDKPYYFPGPVLRRMTAEQIWDSVTTLVIPSPDLRQRGQGYRGALEQMRKEAETLGKVKSSDIVAVARKYADEDFQLELKATVAREKLNKAREANDQKAVQAAQRELNESNDARDNIGAKARVELLKMAGEGVKGAFVSTIKPFGSMMKKDEKKEAPVIDTATASQWNGYGDEFFRASELPSPAPGGHFLREFGQSNREIIENATSEATVSQALNLMNGPTFDKLMMENTQLMQRFRGASTDEGRENAIFMSLFSRKPTDVERAIIKDTIEEFGKDGWKNVVWALLNTREFVFVQ
jgi:hypothetical protein